MLNDSRQNSQYCYIGNTTLLNCSFVGNTLKTTIMGLKLSPIFWKKFLDYWKENCFKVNEKKCIKRRRSSAETLAPVIAELNKEKLVAITVYANVRIVYVGLFTVESGRIKGKWWCCLFTCLTLRALHVKIVSKLVSASCLTVVRRCRYRRGRPIDMISNNGGKFVGGSLRVQRVCRSMEQRQNPKKFRSTRD